MHGLTDVLLLGAAGAAKIRASEEAPARVREALTRAEERVHADARGAKLCHVPCSRVFSTMGPLLRRVTMAFKLGTLRRSSKNPP